MVAVGADGAKFATDKDWQRFGADESNDFATQGNVDDAGTIVQFTYEQIAEFLGDDWLDKLGQLQVEGREAWEVYSVKIGKKSNYTALTDVTELPDFAVSAAGWAQAGRELTDDEKALFVPGTIIEIAYKCDSPVWMVAVGADGAKFATDKDWQRFGVDENNSFATQGSVNADGDKVQFTYEQIAEFLGEDWLDNLGQLQCEGQADWEVYGISIGKKAQ